METPPKAPPSFIPHDATQHGVPRVAASGLLDLVTLVSIVLFVASGALAVGVFLYAQYLQASSTSKLDQLERATAAFEPALIQELARLDDRMRAGGDLLGQHSAPSAFFRMLEQATISSISFRSLSFDAVEPQRISIRMDGVADSVNSIALQADVFSKVGMIGSPIFSNIDRRADGVHFSLVALVNPTTLNYSAIVRNILRSAPQTPAATDDGSASPFAPPAEGEVQDEGAQGDVQPQGE